MQDTELSPEVMKTAEAQAAKDAELMEALKQRDIAKATEHAQAILADVVADEAQQEPFTITADKPQRPPLNRAERRAQVRLYSRMLTLTERQEPFVHPTIVPRSKRRRR